MMGQRMLEQALPHIGGEVNIVRRDEKNGTLILTVKDRSLVNLAALQALDGAAVEFSRSRIILKEMSEETIMAKKDFPAMAEKILALVGGKENVTKCFHCVTRLRFNLADKDQAQLDDLRSVPGVVGVQWSGDQLQIIIGQEVGDVYAAVCKAGGFETKAAIDENLDNGKKKFSVNTILDAFSGSIAPVIPVILAAGLVKVIVFLANMIGILPAESSTYAVLSALGDAGYYFLPVFLGYGAAQKFGANIGLGMYVGALLLHPSLADLIAAGGMTVFGLPIYATSYGSSLFPVILTVAIMAPIQKFIGKHSPTVVRSMVEPLLTLLIITPIALCVTGPLGALIGHYLSELIMTLYGYLGFVMVAIIAAIYPLMVMTGMHSGLTPFMLSAVAAGGDLVVLPAVCVANLCQGASAFAVAVKTKNVDMRSNAISAAISAFVGGVTEPALFGIALPLKTPLIGVVAGGAAGGLMMGIMHVTYYVFGGSGIFALPSFIGGSGSNFIWAIVAFIVGVVVSFLTTYLLYKPKEA